MRRLLCSLLLLSGCTTRPATNPAEITVNAAVKERYWRRQSGQRLAPDRSVTILLPERVEDGARRAPTLVEIKLP